MTKLIKVFREIDAKRVVERELRDLKQTALAVEYLVEFFRILLKLLYNKDSYILKYYDGLKEQVKDKIS
jgi:hypothetical protein